MDPLLIHLVRRCHQHIVGSRASHILAIMVMSMQILLSCRAPLALAVNQSVIDWVYSLCNTAQFSSNETFAANFNAVKESLTLNSSQTLYSSASSRSGFDESSYVFGIYQCRGDVSLSDCSTCVSNALSRVLTVCNSTRGARTQYIGCYIRYENYDFTSGVERDGDYPPIPKCSSLNDSSPVYQHNLGTALNSTASAAPKHALFGYNASSAGTGSSARAYALSQCLGYVPPSKCATCLSVVSNYSGECNNSVSGGVYFTRCYYLYDNTSFLFTNSNNSTSRAANPFPISPSSSPSPISSPTKVRRKNQRNATPIIIGVVVGASLGIITTIIIFISLCYLKRRTKATNFNKALQGSSDAASNIDLPSTNGVPQQAASGATRFSRKELQEATDDFNPRNKLGEGGFGSVFQGTLQSGRQVAIKILSAESCQGKAQFINEVNLMATLQHRNLVQLIGYCVDDFKQPLLVYEYLPNRSLDLHLFDTGEKDPLDWCARFEIIVGLARGLTYLHEDSHVRIVHRDIKASNILLDKNLNPLIADFGLARFFGDDVTHLTTKVVGTLGYLSPEYAIGGQLSEKADVYSFGLVALEVVSGRKVIDYKSEADQQNLLGWTWALYEKQQQLQIVDRRMLEGSDMDVNVEEVVRVVHVALLCTQSPPHLRPRMSDVYNILKSRSTILELPRKPML